VHAHTATLLPITLTPCNTPSNLGHVCLYRKFVDKHPQPDQEQTFRLAIEICAPLVSEHVGDIAGLCWHVDLALACIAGPDFVFIYIYIGIPITAQML